MKQNVMALSLECFVTALQVYWNAMLQKSRLLEKAFESFQGFTDSWKILFLQIIVSPVVLSHWDIYGHGSLGILQVHTLVSGDNCFISAG